MPKRNTVPICTAMPFASARTSDESMERKVRRRLFVFQLSVRGTLRIGRRRQRRRFGIAQTSRLVRFRVSVVYFVAFFVDNCFPVVFFCVARDDEFCILVLIIRFLIGFLVFFACERRTRVYARLKMPICNERTEETADERVFERARNIALHIFARVRCAGLF